MALEQRSMQAYEIDFLCDSCGKGHYRPDKCGITSSMTSGDVIHWCDACDDKKVLPRRFPYIEFRAMSQPIAKDNPAAITQSVPFPYAFT